MEHNASLEVVIVGGVAGGASTAARLRRLNEHISITMYEMAGSISFGTCGMPYYLGGVVDDRSKLFLLKAEDFMKQFKVNVVLQTKVTKIDREGQLVHWENVNTGEKGTKKFDRLVLATGAKPNALPIPGLDLPGVFTLRGAWDMDRVHDFLESKPMKKIGLIGAGMIGMELAENMIKKGITDVTLIEAKNQVGGPLDFEIAHVLQTELTKHGVKVILNEFVTSITEGPSSNLVLTTKGGQTVEADIVIIGVGVSPDNSLAVEAGLEIGTSKGIKVNEHMQTSDPNIYAVGDVIEVRDFITGANVSVPLAGPASRQGRIAADNICGRNSSYRGTQGTAIVGIFDTAAAMTGASEKWLQSCKIPHLKAYVHPNDHVAYYPGAKLVSIKILFTPDTGRVLGAQVVGNAAVDKEIDALAVAIQAKMTVYDLEEMELAYSPAYGSPKSPVNMAGFVGAGMLRGDQTHVSCENVIQQQTPVLVDVRPEAAWKSSGVPGSLNIPLAQLRTRMTELPKDKQIIVVCFQGKTAYNGYCVLKQHGYDAVIMGGGVTTYNHIKPSVK